MKNRDKASVILEAREIATKLHDLLLEDSQHRLRLYGEYACEVDRLKWTPDLHRRNLLAESLCKKLDSLVDSRQASPISYQLIDNSIQY